MKYRIYPIPFEVRGLEYLNLLHKYISGKDAAGNEFVIEHYSWSKLFFRRAHRNERNVIHAHWETNIYGSKYALVSIGRMLIRFPALWLLKLRGVRIFWTMHNLTAHDYPYPMIDAIGKRIMWHLADIINIQERKVAVELAAAHPGARVITIPQGNYVGIYGPLWHGDREVLRRSYGLLSGEILLLALGSVRPYKALPMLIEVVTEVRTSVPIKLLIMGKASSAYESYMKTLAAGNSAVDLRIGFVPDEKIPEVLAVADYSVFYYEDSSLSSAAMIMSLSYGTPVITRDIPASAIITEGVSGFVFHDVAGLRRILLGLPSQPKLDRSAIIDTVKDQDWPTVGAEHREAYIKLWTHQ